MTWTAGDVSGSQTLTSSDHIYAGHINELRTSADALSTALQAEIDSSISSVQAQYKTTLTVGFSNADYICDGTADNVQFQQAINALTALGGGTLWYKAPVVSGTVYDFVQRVIILSSNIVVKGTYGAVIKMHALSDQEAFVVGNGHADDTAAGDSGPVVICNDTFFEDVVIDGNKANQTAAAGFTAIRYGVSATRNLIRWRSDAQTSYGGGATRCRVYNGIQNGLSCESHAQGMFINNTVINMDQNGMWAENGSNWTIAFNNSQHNGQDTSIGGSGIRILSFNGGSIIGNDCKGDRGSSISVLQASNISVVGNQCYRAGWEGATTTASSGMYISNGTQNTITGNTFYGCYANGLVLNGQNYSIVSANGFRRNGQYTNNTYSDIYLTFEGGGSGNHNNSIIGNTFQNDTATFYSNRVKYNISADSPSAHYNNVFTGNVFGVSPDNAATAAAFNVFQGNVWGPHVGVNPQSTYNYGYFGSSTQTIDPKVGFLLQGTSYATTTAVTIAAGAYDGQQFMLQWFRDAGGTKTLTWTNAAWAGGIAPSFSTNSPSHDFMLFTWNLSNSTWYGVHLRGNILNAYVSSGEAVNVSGTTQADIRYYKAGTRTGIVGFGSNGDIFSGALTDSLAVRAENALHLGAGGDHLGLTVDTSGNVGIGTTSPSGNKLKVSGNVDATSYTVSGVAVLSRSVVSITSSVTLGATAGTDYVALIGASGAPILPTAVSNTNRYTLKNVDSTNKTVSTTSSQTIDGSTTITLTPNTSVDCVSDGANWRLI